MPGPTAYMDTDLLRFTTAGSVDDGKSTLIGRLLHDTKSIFEDQMEQIEGASRKLGNEGLNLALLTDGLRAEREQKITIDVAYRYFATPRRKFIIADTPGHIQYTRNMVTGASTAELAIVLVDARRGLLTQSKRHAFITSLLGIPHMIVAVNKMDLVDYSEEVYDKIRSDFTEFSTKLTVKDISYVPISALHGDNVAERSKRMPWYRGGALLHMLETVNLGARRNHIDFASPYNTSFVPTKTSGATPERWLRERLAPEKRSSSCRRAKERGCGRSRGPAVQSKRRWPARRSYLPRRPSSIFPGGTWSSAGETCRPYAIASKPICVG